MENNYKVGRILYQQDNNGKALINELRGAIGKPGVWTLYGKEKSDPDSRFYCLNVGKSEDVGREILYDVGCLNYLPFVRDGEKKYINQFAEDCGFCDKTKMTQEYLYPYIVENYLCLTFVLICNDSNDEECEKMFAWYTHARFWRNGRSFGKAGEDCKAYINYFKKYYKEELEAIGYQEPQEYIESIEELENMVSSFYKNYTKNRNNH